MMSSSPSAVFDHQEVGRSDECRKSIVIVGAGLAGLAMCLGLAKISHLDGYDIHLVEKMDDWARKGAAFGLSPGGVKALEELCPAAMDRIRVKAIPNDLTEGGYFMGWWLVRDVLLDQVQSLIDQGRVRLYMGWSCFALENEEGSEYVTASFSRSTSYSNDGETSVDVTMTLSGSLLVGADGVHSNVRDLLGLPPATLTGKIKWRGSFTVPDGSILEPFLGKGVMPFSVLRGGSVFALFSFHPQTPRAMCFTITTKHDNVPPGSRPQDYMNDFYGPESTVEDDKIKLMDEAFALCDIVDLHMPFDHSVIDIPTPDFLKIEGYNVNDEEDGAPTRADRMLRVLLDTADSDLPSLCTTGWGGRGRVTLIGDAAHAMRPTSGLGGTIAFEDCLIFSRMLAARVVDSDGQLDVLAVWAQMDSLIREFEGSRVPRVKIIWNDQQDIAENLYKGKPYRKWPQEFADWVYGSV